jgi:hypothetical protein
MARKDPRLAQPLERGADLGGEQAGLFPGGEVTAPVDLVVVDELVVGAFAPAARGRELHAALAPLGGTACRLRRRGISPRVAPSGTVGLAAPSVRARKNFNYGESAQPRTYLLAAKTELAD